MLKKILAHLTALLDEYLRRTFPQPEGVAEAGFIGGATDDKPGKLIVSLINIERETAGGISAGYRRSGNEYERSHPPLMLNLDLMLAAVYDDKRYAESLAVLSETLSFLQSHPSFDFEGNTYTLEVVTLSAQDINNIWTTLGGQYYPSVMCKLRRLIVDTGETAGTGSVAREPEVYLAK